MDVLHPAGPYPTQDNLLRAAASQIKLSTVGDFERDGLQALLSRGPREMSLPGKELQRNLDVSIKRASGPLDWTPDHT